MLFINKKINNKEHTYGKYKILSIDSDTLMNKINENIKINTSNNKVELELFNVPILIRYQLETFTNVSDFYNIDNEFDEILNTNDRKLKKVLRELKNNIVIIANDTKKQLEGNFTEINNNLEKIVNILLQ